MYKNVFFRFSGYWLFGVWIMSAACYGGFGYYPRLGLCNSRIVCISGTGGGVRWQVLKKVDEELSKGDDRAALSLVKDLQGKPGGLRCFGAARQVRLPLNITTIQRFSNADGVLLQLSWWSAVIDVGKLGCILYCNHMNRCFADTPAAIFVGRVEIEWNRNRVSFIASWCHTGFHRKKPATCSFIWLGGHLECATLKPSTDPLHLFGTFVFMDIWLGKEV